MNGVWGISYEIALRWMPLDLTDDKSTLIQVMAWCLQATSHYLSQCWPRSMSPNGVTRPQWVNASLAVVQCHRPPTPCSVLKTLAAPVYLFYYTPRFNEVERGYTSFTLSICGQNRVCSVSSTILVGSILYLYILSSNFRRYVACKVCFKIQQFEILANSLNL